MNRSTLLATFSSLILLTAPAFAAPASNANTAESQKLYKIATIKGANAVREFEHNVQVLHADRNAAVQLEAQIKAEKDSKTRKELQTRLDQAMDKLKTDNETMSKAYGFSITRNYQMEVESANIYIVLTPEEAAKIEKEQAAKQKK